MTDRPGSNPRLPAGLSPTEEAHWWDEHRDYWDGVGSQNERIDPVQVRRTKPVNLRLPVKMIDQLKREHDQRLEDLKTELEAVNRLLELELRRLETAPSAAMREQVHHAPRQDVTRHAPQHAPQHPAQHVPHQAQAPAQPQLPLADFLIRKLNEAGAMSRDDLRRFSLQEGYFADAESADRGVHSTLLNVVKAGLIRQLPNGNFAPATVLDTIRLRRAM